MRGQHQRGRAARSSSRSPRSGTAAARGPRPGSSRPARARWRRPRGRGDRGRRAPRLTVGRSLVPCEGVTVRTSPARAPLALAPAHRAELLARCERAVRARAARARARCWPRSPSAVGPDVDPSAVAFASRRAGEPWFCFEQPDRDGAALAALGCARAIRTGGARRFADAAATWRELAARRRGRRARRARRRRARRRRRLRVRARGRRRAATGRASRAGDLRRPGGRARAPRRRRRG